MNSVLKCAASGAIALTLLSACTPGSSTTEAGAGASAVHASQIAAPATPSAPQIDPQAVQVVKKFIGEDLVGWAVGKKAEFAEWHANNMGMPVRVSAIDLSRSYDANEVAADNAYKDRTLWITGTVEAISKDAFDRPYLVLQGAQMFHEVHASMDNSALNEIATWRKGNIAHLVCKGDGMILGSPMTSQCVTVQMAVDQAKKTENAWIDSFFAGKEGGRDELRVMSALVYIWATKLPAESSCHKTIDNACRKEFEKGMQLINADVIKQHAELLNYLKIPSRNGEAYSKS